MPRRTLTKATPWDDARSAVAYTRASLQVARERAEAKAKKAGGKGKAGAKAEAPDAEKDAIFFADLEKLLVPHLGAWLEVNRQVIEAVDGMTAGNARVRRIDADAEIVITDVHHDVLALVRQNRKDKLFVRLFPKPLSTLLRNALGRLVGQARDLLAALGQSGMPTELAGHQTRAIEDLVGDADDALQKRRSAEATRDAAGGQVQGWKDEANKHLRTVEGRLGEHAAQRGLSVGWVDSFFLPPERNRSKRAGDKGPTPGPA